ncbi:MAG: hypothetical protein HUJ90_06255 [Bacteroidales bacterium]|nr:hypothetical protein [Bacteroidales bacterium]
MKQIFAFISLMLFCSVNLLSQELEIVSALKYEGSISASSVPVDNNNEPCSKIIVDVPLEDVRIEGAYIVGDVAYSGGRYELFVSVPKKYGQKINIRHKDYGGIDIPLWTSEGALIGKEAYRVTLKATRPQEIVFSKHNQFYADIFFQAGGLMGFGLTVGAHFHAVNAEIEINKGIGKSDEVYWYDQNKLIASAKYSTLSGNVKLGYGFQPHKKFYITPQAGFGLVKCLSSGDNPGKNANAVFALVGCRGTFVFAKHLQIVVAPYYNFAVKKSASFEEIAKVHTSINRWSNGFNIKIGVSIFF